MKLQKLKAKVRAWLIVAAVIGECVWVMLRPGRPDEGIDCVDGAIYDPDAYPDYWSI